MAGRTRDSATGSLTNRITRVNDRSCHLYREEEKLAGGDEQGTAQQKAPLSKINEQEIKTDRISTGGSKLELIGATKLSGIGRATKSG